MRTIREAPRAGIPYAVRPTTTDEAVDRALRDAQRCAEQTAYGMPYPERCGARTLAGTPYCPEHQPRCPRCDRPLGWWPLVRGDNCAPRHWVRCIRPDPRLGPDRSERSTFGRYVKGWL